MLNSLVANLNLNIKNSVVFREKLRNLSIEENGPGKYSNSPDNSYEHWVAIKNAIFSDAAQIVGHVPMGSGAMNGRG